MSMNGDGHGISLLTKVFLKLEPRARCFRCRYCVRQYDDLENSLWCTDVKCVHAEVYDTSPC